MSEIIGRLVVRVENRPTVTTSVAREGNEVSKGNEASWGKIKRRKTVS